jgi:hypothetical protein
LGFSIDDLNEMKVFSIYGEMDYGVHYYYTNNGSVLVIRRENVDLSRGMIIEMYNYVRIDDEIL